MKNIFLTFILLMTVSFAFALNAKENSLLIHKTTSILKSSIPLNYNHTFIKSKDGTCTIYHFVYRNGRYIGRFEVTAPDSNPDCYGVVFDITYK